MACSTLVVVLISLVFLASLSFLPSLSLVVVVVVLRLAFKLTTMGLVLRILALGGGRGRLGVIPSRLAEHVSETKLADTVAVGDLTFGPTHVRGRLEDVIL